MGNGCFGRVEQVKQTKRFLNESIEDTHKETDSSDETIAVNKRKDKKKMEILTERDDTDAKENVEEENEEIVTTRIICIRHKIRYVVVR